MWHFRHEKSEDFSETSAFRPKPLWRSPKGHPSLEVFLSRLKKERFSNEINESMQSDRSVQEWKALRALTSDKTML